MKLILNTSDASNEFFEDRKILGIVSSLKNYVFCWHIFNALDLQFITSADLQIKMDKAKRSYLFTIYQCLKEKNHIEHLIYSNKNDGEFLIPELQHFDFLWLIKDPLHIYDSLEPIKTTIKQISGVQLITELQLEKIKAKDNFLY